MTEHDRFESAYRECFPVASSMQADLFERDDDGYIEAKVHTAFTLWKAARATPSDHIGEAAEKVDAGSVPVAWIRMDHLRQAQQAPFMCRVEPEFRKGLDLAPFYLAAPQAPQSDAQSVRGEVIEGLLHRLNDATKPIDAADRNILIRILKPPTPKESF